MALKFNYHGPLALALPVAGEGVSYLDLFAKAYSLRLKRRNPSHVALRCLYNEKAESRLLYLEMGMSLAGSLSASENGYGAVPGDQLVISVAFA